MTAAAIQAEEFAVIKKDVGDIKTLLGKVVEVMSRFAVLEERQQSTTDAMGKIVDRLERMETRQHQADISNARSDGNGTRLQALEVSVKELHLDNERNKTRLATSAWIARMGWTVGGTVVASAIWAFNTFGTPLVAVGK